MMKIYGAGGNRWVRPYWTAREADVAFEPIKLSFANGDLRKESYLALNPFAKAPALEDGPVKIFESAAICNYIADKRPEKKLAPALGTPERAQYDQWVSFVISDFEQPLWRIVRHSFVYPEPKRSLADVTLAKEDFRHNATILERIIPDGNLLGENFTVADILMAYTLKWATMERVNGENMLVGFPRLQKYLAKHEARPAFPRELYT